MSNFGFFDLRLVNAYSVAYQEARSAVGAAVLLQNAREFASVGEAVADRTLVVGTTAIGHRHLEHTIRRLEQATPLLRRARRVALLFGSEKFGLSNEDMSHCHWLLRIPTRKDHGTMNLGQAVSVCLYELIRSGRAGGRAAQARPG
jgi:TrmH family RNA methyltransferase